MVQPDSPPANRSRIAAKGSWISGGFASGGVIPSKARRCRISLLIAPLVPLGLPPVGSADAVRVVPAPTFRTIAASQIAVDMPVTQFDDEALATLPTGYVSPADLLAATWASFGMRVVQHSPHLMVSDGDREFVLAVSTTVLKVHLITHGNFGCSLSCRYQTPGISLYRTLVAYSLYPVNSSCNV